jgi:hypothetical protein
MRFLEITATEFDDHPRTLTPNVTPPKHRAYPPGAASGSAPKVTVTGALTASSTIKPACFTVDTLPAASEAGPGATAYAPNGRRAGEGQGAGIPVWSDGTAWRTYYDNTVVAQ